MNIELDGYDKMAEFGPVQKFERLVKTPGVDGENRKVFYKTKDRFWKVSRISTLGWSVTEYDEKGRPKRRSSSYNLDYFDTEAEAHALAKEWVQEYVEE